MSSIVDDLVTQALDDSVPIDSLLRRVKAVAALLDLDELAQWADRELYGYQAEDEIPPYRMMTGELQARSPFRGWEPVKWQSQEMRRRISTQKIWDSIGEIWDRVQRRDQDTGCCRSGHCR